MEPTLFTETQLRLMIGTVCFFIGLLVGWLIWRNRVDTGRTLSALQILSVFIFFGYLAFNAIIGREPSDLVATAILTMIGGELVGKAIADKVKKNENS